MSARAGVAALAAAYFLSQFYRAFLAVLADTLERELGASKADLSDAQAVWFLAFALMQFPIGWALDRHGPRWTSAALFAAGGAGGAAWFAAATGPGDVIGAMALIGIGCSPVLMASLYIYARSFDPTRFAAYTAVLIGVGTFGNVAASAPLTWAAETVGWRGAMLGLAAITLAVALICALTVRNPPRAEAGGGRSGGLLELLRIRALWPIYPLMVASYAAAAGLRGLWAGPYMTDVFALDAMGVGDATLAMAIGLALGNFFYAPLDRWLGSRKTVVFAGNAATAILCAAMAAFAAASPAVSTVLLTAIGFFGVSYAVIMAHGRAFFPPHLVGRGVTIMNFCSIGGVAALQFASGRIAETYAPMTGSRIPIEGYQTLFLFYAGVLGGALVVYAFSRDAKP